MSDDQPKISKHHTGQHPALQSFRAFDIIPPSKVQPAHTARPIITNPAKHFDNTLTPTKSGTPTPAPDVPADEPEQQPVKLPDLTAVDDAAHSTAHVPPITEPVETEQAPADQPTTPDLSDTSAEASNVVEITTATPSETADPPVSVDASPESTHPDDSGNLGSILAQGAGQLSPNDAATASVAHSSEFASVLQEFAAQPTKPTEARPVVAVHQHNYWRGIGLFLLWLVVTVVLAAVIVDILLDTQTLQTTYSIPHTHFFSPKY